MNGRGEADLTVDIRNQHRGEFALTARMTAAGGETIAVMGPSGAGKSTMLALIAGRLRLQAGSIGIAGRVVSSPQQHVPAAARDVVMLGQDPLLFPHLNVRENIAFGRRARGVGRGQARDEAEQWLHRIGLPGTGDRMPADLSGGQQQRVALARALITQPRVLLLDEPLTSLDAITAHEVRAVLQPQLREATAAPMTTVMVTHDALDATALADRLVLIESGTITHDAPVREVFAAPRTDFAASIVGVNRLPGSVLGEDAGASVIIRPGDVHLNLVSDLGTGPGRSDARGPESRSWQTRIARLEQTPTGVRAYLDDPTLFVDLAIDDALARGLVEGAEVTATAQEWRVLPAVPSTA